MMKKKQISLLLAAAVAVSLTGCGNVSSVTDTVGEAASSVTGTVSEAAGSLVSAVSERLGISSAETETEFAAGQRKATIQVVSITGNELTYIEETEEETETEAETETDTSEEEETGTET
ncbi:MAG: hypothetical protein LUG93_00305, partial [Lachnospiraceae bacterium]|nr:hypothetical protein [Lachnospiraceae bacterium]